MHWKNFTDPRSWPQIIRNIVMVGVLLALFKIIGLFLPPTYPWGNSIPVAPAYEIISKEKVTYLEDSSIYVVSALAKKGSTRDEVKAISAKIIESLPKHNMAILCFYSDRKETEENYVARTWWGPEDTYPEAGNYQYNRMKIALPGEKLPGVEIKHY